MASASKYQTIATDVLRGVGGSENVASVVHCATRLRFKLRDRDKADKAAVEATSGVITVMESGGQFQVVIGNTVGRVHEALTELGVNTGEGGGADDDGGGAKGNLLARFIDLITSIFTPFLWVLAGTGLLKALLAVVVKIAPDFGGTTTYAIWYAAGDAAFQFLPIFIAITAARKFKANIYTAVAIAGAMIYSDLIAVVGTVDAEGNPITQTLKAFSDSGGEVTFFGIPVVLVSYLSAVIPTILAIYAQSKLEIVIAKILPDALRNFLMPMLVLMVIVPVTFLVIGPVSDLLATGLANGIDAVWSSVPWLGGLLIGAFWQVFVIFGVHWGFVPIMAQELVDPGYSFITAALFPAVLAQTGAVLGVMIKTRNKDLRRVAGPAAISGFFAGITEPAIYGVTLRLKKPFIYACIGGAVGGAIAAAGKSAADVFALPGAITLTATMNHGSFAMQLLGSGLGILIAFVLTMTLGFKDIPETPETTDGGASGAGKAGSGSAASGVVPAPLTGGGTATLTGTRTTQILAPVAGTALALDRVSDPVFASGALGKGAAVAPSDGRVVAPVSGTVVSVLPHAYGLTTPDGVEVLVHVGLNTVQMEGKGFTPAVAAGAQVDAGDLLVTADLSAIRAAGLDPTTVVVVTNTDAHEQVLAAAVGAVLPSSTLLEVHG